MKDTYSLAELEAAINYWRMRSPSQGDELSLCPQTAALAEPYALMIFNNQRTVMAQDLTPKACDALALFFAEAPNQAVQHN